MELLFFLTLFLIFFSYIGYPLSLVILSLFRNHPVERSQIFPSVSLILTVYNEERRIEEKLRNTLELDYPRECFQILVASDGSIDRTNAIVSSYREMGVELLELAERKGKEHAQKAAIAVASGELIVFTDVATILPGESIKTIVSNFSDPSVGSVSGEDRMLVAEGNVSGENLYVRYEMWLRGLESRVNSLVGVSGSFFAARKEVCMDFSVEMQSDFRTVLNCIKLGMRAVTDPLAVGYYKDVSDGRREYERKVRTVLRGITVFFNNTEYLNVVRYGLFSYQYLCHKLLRWLVPIFLILLLLFNVVLAPRSMFYLIVLAAQFLFYVIGFTGIRRTDLINSVFKKIPVYFVLVNISILQAWFRFAKGDRIVRWTPSER
jgi:glycosyltransferase involved in cell wall biosynthesis